MKTLILTALLLCPLAQAADGLISVPDDAVLNAPGSSSDSRFLDFGLEDPGIPDSSDPEVYVQWVKNRIEAHKKSAMATRAFALRPAPDVACLRFHDAFGFQAVNENEFKLNCFAGNGKKISHVLDYHMRVTYIPADCASEQRIRDYFKIPVYANRRAAQDFWSMLSGTCMIQAEPVNPATPVQKSVGVSQDFVNKALNGREDLRLYVNGSKKRKSGDTGSGYSNPLKSGNQSAE